MAGRPRRGTVTAAQVCCQSFEGLFGDGWLRRGSCPVAGHRIGIQHGQPRLMLC